MAVGFGVLARVARHSLKWGSQTSSQAVSYVLKGANPMAIFPYALLFIPLTFALCCLVPAGAFGPAAPGSRRGWVAVGLAILLSWMGSRWLFRCQNFAMFSFCSYAIAALVGGVAGRRAGLYGTLASLWYLAYSLLDWSIFASPEQIQALGRFPIDAQIFLCVILPGHLGAVAASGVLRLEASEPASNAL